MPLVFHDPMGEFSAPIGTVISSVREEYWRNGLNLDPISCAFAGAVVECGVLPVSAMIGSFRFHGEPRHIPLNIEKPRQHRYESQVDASRYGGALNQLPLLYRTLSEQHFPGFTPGNQNGVSHLAYHGNLGPRFSWNPLHTYGTDIEPYPFVGQPRYQASAGYYGVPNLRPYDKVFVGDSGNVPLVDKDGISGNDPPMATLRERRKLWKIYYSIPRRWDWFSYCPTTTIIYDFESFGDDEDLELHIRYKYVLATMDWGGFYDAPATPRYEEVHEVEWFVKPTLHVPEATFYAEPNTWYNLQDVCGYTARCVDNFYQWIPFFPGGPPFGGHPLGITETIYTGSGSVLLAHPTAGDDLGTSEFTFTPLIKATRPYDFKSLVNQRSTDIIASAYLSSADALHSEPVISTNLIEAANDFEGLKALLPSLPSLGEVLRLMNSKGHVQSWLAITQWLAGFTLYGAFDLQPNLRLLQDVLPVLREFVDGVNPQLTHKRFYGKFRYEFPEWEFGRKQTFLETRSLISLPRDKNSLGGLMDLSSLGIAPLPDKVWEAIPLSFVIEWVTNFGSRLEAVTWTLLGATLPDLRVTHTFRVFSYLTDEELAILPAKQAHSYSTHDKPRLQVMFRDVSRYFPTPRESKYEFLAPTGVPLLTGGALALLALLSLQPGYS